MATVTSAEEQGRLIVEAIVALGRVETECDLPDHATGALASCRSLLEMYRPEGALANGRLQAVS